MVHIELVHYRGKNGGFATRHTDLWISRIVGSDDTKRLCDPSNPHGDTNRLTALVLAEDWAQFLGVEITEVEGEENISGRPPS